MTKKKATQIKEITVAIAIGLIIVGVFAIPAKLNMDDPKKMDNLNQVEVMVGP